MSLGSSIVSALAGGLVALGGLTYTQTHVNEGLIASANAATASETSASDVPPSAAVAAARKAEVRASFRRLFDDRIAYLRGSLIASIGNTPDAAAADARLMKNQDEIAAALRTYLGDQAPRVTTLLKENATLTLATVKAVRGDKGKLAAARKSWSNNAEAIATALSAANPNWPKTTIGAMLDKHLELTLRVATARLLQDWPADIKAYDESRQQILALADAIADGIIRQFPARFAG